MQFLFVVVGLIAVGAPELSYAQENPRAPDAKVQYTRREWNFDQVDVAKWQGRLARVGLELPVELDGQISGKLVAEIPWGALFEGKAWRLEGTLTSAKLAVDKLSLRDVRLRLAYRDGMLRLTDFRLRVPPPVDGDDAAAGVVSGTADMQLNPRGQLTATLDVDELPLGYIEQFTEALGPFDGRLSGTLAAEVEVDRLRDLAAWSISGPVRVEKLSTAQLPPTDVAVQLDLRDGKLTARRFQLKLGATQLTGTANVTLLDKRPWNLDAAATSSELDALLRLLGQLFDRADLAAAADAFSADFATGAVKLRGTLRPSLGPIAGRAEFRGVRLVLPGGREIAVQRVAFDYAMPTLDRLELTAVDAALLDGTADGAATIHFGEPFGASAELQWREINGGALAREFGAPSGAVAGRSAGTLTLTIPRGALDDREKWSATGSIGVSEVNVGGAEFRLPERLALRLQAGRLELPRIAAEFGDSSIRGAVSVGIAAPWEYAADLSINKLSGQQLQALPQLAALRGRIEGVVDLNAKVGGALQPLSIAGGGTIGGESLRFDQTLIDRVSADYQLSLAEFQLNHVDATLYDGRLQGELKLGLKSGSESSAQLKWHGIDAARWLSEFADLSVKLQGQTDGALTLVVPDGAWDSIVNWTLEAEATIDRLTAGGVNVASLTAKLDQRDRRLDYSAVGSLAGGKLQVTGKKTRRNESVGLAALGSVEATLRGARLDKAAAALLDRSSPMASLAGSLDAKFSSAATADAWQWKGDLQIPNVTLPNATLTNAKQSEPALAKGVRVQVAGTESQIRIDNISGSVAGGQLSGGGSWSIDHNRGRVLRLGLRRGDMQQIAMIAGVSGDAPLAGPADLQLRIRAGDVWRVDGTVGVGRGELQDVDVNNARVPFTIDWNPAGDRMNVTLTSGSAAVARGRIAGRLTARQSYGWNLNGKYRFYRIDVATLFRELGSKSNYGNGRLTGTLDISGRNVRSPGDVQAKLVGDLNDARASDFPVLPELRRFVPGFGASGATKFGKGRIEARLSNGVVQIDRLSLASSKLRIYIDGRVDLVGRLRLKAVIATGQMGNPTLANSLLSDIVAVPAAPLAAVQAANDFLSNRVIYLEIRGTVARPIIRPRPFQSLPREAVRFFLRRATGGLAGGTAVGNSPAD